MDALFEKMMIEVRKSKNKQAVIAIIRQNHLLFKEQKLKLANKAFYVAIIALAIASILLIFQLLLRF